MKSVVISAVNFTEGGPLTVLRDCLQVASEVLDDEWQIYAIVNNKNLINNSRITFLELPQVKGSWFRRVKAEWFDFGALFDNQKIDLWFSLHDMTPRVNARRQVVYCHNPSPFYNIGIKEVFLEPKFGLFNLFYRYLYGAFIGRNFAVVVQQEWLREKFMNLFGVKNVIVSYPSLVSAVNAHQGDFDWPAETRSNQRTIFLYPALPRVFKNIEVICEAIQMLPEHLKRGVELRLTLSGHENRYARYIYNRFSSIEAIKFIGRLDYDEMMRQYRVCDAVLFPSKLETWGVPLTEAKYFNKPIFVADLPYSHETVGAYDAVEFLDADSPACWRNALVNFIDCKCLNNSHTMPTPSEPFARGWHNLWKTLINGL